MPAQLLHELVELGVQERFVGREDAHVDVGQQLGEVVQPLGLAEGFLVGTQLAPVFGQASYNFV